MGLIISSKKMVQLDLKIYGDIEINNFFKKEILTE